jgi:hypothetical protein
MRPLELVCAITITSGVCANAATTAADNATLSRSVRERVERLIQSVSGTTNLSELEIYDGTTNRWDHIRSDVVKLICLPEGGSPSVGEKFIQVFQIPSSNYFYLQSHGMSGNEAPIYSGPFEGAPLKVLATRQDVFARSTRPPNAPIANSVLAEADNPLGLDDEMIIRLFATGKRLKSVAHVASDWARRHQMALSSSLDEVYAPYLNRDEAREDPFGDSKVRMVDFEGKIRIYSVGPDGVWDDGKAISNNDPYLKGDLGVEAEIGKYDVRLLADGALLDYLEGKHTARYLAKKGKHYGKASAPLERVDGNLRFGPVVDGLSAAVELIPRGEDFVLDQAVEVRFHIRNEADYEIQVAGSSWRQGDKLILQRNNGESSPGERRREIPVSRVYYNGMSLTQREVLKPGQSMVFRSSGLKFHGIDTSSRAGSSDAEVGKEAVGYHPQQVNPGPYVLRFQMNFPGWNAELMDWRGELETGAVAVVVQ